jgi:hypothetical protein
MIRLDGRYSRLDILPEDTAVSEGIADSYCPTEAAVVERSDCPSHTLHDCYKCLTRAVLKVGTYGGYLAASGQRSMRLKQLT